MENHMNEIDPKVKDCFYAAMNVVRNKIGNEFAVNLIREHLIPALVDYNEAAFMHGYFRACSQMLPEYRIIFYEAATAMIHFKYYHYNEDKTHDKETYQAPLLAMQR